MINNISFNKRLYYLVFFLCGLNLSYLYIPLFLLCVLKDSHKYLITKFNWRFLLLYFLFIAFISTLFAIGYPNFNMEKPYRVFIIVSSLGIVLGLVLNHYSPEVRRKMLNSYLLGISVQTLIIICYSYYTDPLVYGYSKLLDPFSGEQINSPSVSNNLTLFAVLLFTIFLQREGLILKLLSLFLLLITFYFAIFLGGRAFFVVSIVAFFAILASRMKLSSMLNLFIIVAIMIFFGNLLMQSDSHFQFIAERFSSGVESNRFKHYLYALNQMPYYPFGGFEVDSKIENTLWLHNLIFDSARVAGWIPVFVIIFYTVISFLLYKTKNPDSYNKYGFLFFLCSFLLMQQDVVVEGNYRLLVVFFFSTILMNGDNNVIHSDNNKL